MSNPLKDIYQAVKTVLSVKEYLASFLIIAFSVFLVLFEIQVNAIPGNSNRFQIAWFGYKDWLIFGLISVFNSLFIVMQLYLHQLKKKQKQALNLSGEMALSGVGTFSGLLASLFGTATCGLCVGALFGFLGANSILFLVNNRGIITAGSLLFMIVALILVSKRFNTTCKVCSI